MVIKNIPNFITMLRIVGTICLWFIEPFTAMFFAVYTLSGVSDALDGIVARAMNTTSELGTKLDSIADILFYATLTIRTFPILWEELPLWLWWAAAAVVTVRVFSYLFAAIKFHCFATLHTYMNKLTGFIFFSLPYAISLGSSVQWTTLLFIVSAASTIEELVIHIVRKEYRSNIKSVIA